MRTRRHTERRSGSLGVDVVGALNLVGSLVKYLGAGVPVPDGDRARLRRAGVAVPRVRRATRGRSALGLERVTRRQGAHRRARGLPRRLADLAAGRRLRRAALRARRAAAVAPGRRLFESMSGFSTTGASVLDRRRGACSRSMRDVAAVHGLARRRRDHRPVPRGAAAAARRRPPGAVQDRDGRAGAAAGGDDPRDRPPLRRALRRRSRRSRSSCSPGSGWTGVDPRMTCLQRGRARVRDDRHRRLLDRGALDRAVRPGDAVGRRRLHARRRHELRAALRGHRRRRSGALRRDEEFRVYLVLLGGRLADRARRAPDRRHPRAEATPYATPSSTPCR